MNGSSSPATVTIVVSENHAAVAAADAYEIGAGQVLQVTAPGVLANDSDPDGNPIRPIVEFPPAHGTVMMNNDGSFTYTPTPGFTGVDTFVYRVFDLLGPGNPATVTFTVTGN